MQWSITVCESALHVKEAMPAALVGSTLTSPLRVIVKPLR